MAGTFPTLLKITQVKDHGDVVVALAQEVPDRSAAEAMRGARVFIGRTSFPTAGPDEFYWVDLIGLDVVNREGAALGKVVGLLDTGPHSVLRVMPADETKDEAERLIPFVAAYVDEVSLEQRRVTVDWGLDYWWGRTCLQHHHLFPELFAPHLTQGITRRAFEQGRSMSSSGSCATMPATTTAVSTTVPYGGGPAW